MITETATLCLLLPLIYCVCVCAHSIKRWGLWSQDITLNIIMNSGPLDDWILRFCTKLSVSEIHHWSNLFPCYDHLRAPFSRSQTVVCRIIAGRKSQIVQLKPCCLLRKLRPTVHFGLIKPRSNSFSVTHFV